MPDTGAAHSSSAPTRRTQPTRRPRVVLFRANAMDSDSRAKKVGLTLARLGYDVYALSAETDETAPSHGIRRLGRSDGPQVTVLPVRIGRSNRELHRHLVAARRRRQLRFVDWTPRDEYVTQVRELRGRVRRARCVTSRLLHPDRRPSGPEADSRSAPDEASNVPTGRPRPMLLGVWVGRYLTARAALTVRMLRWRAQWAVNVGHRLAWRRWDDLRQKRSLLVTTRGALPEVEDYAAAFAPVLDDLAPDVIHVHHPLVLGTAVRAARRRRAAGQACYVVYDAREDFLGIPAQEQGHRRRHTALVREEARHIRSADAVLTVSEPITRTLAERYHLSRRPTLVLNVPVDDERIRPGAVDAPTVRDAAGLPDDVPLLVYGGAVSRARGIDVIVAALPLLPGVHAAVVAVPHPHPHAGELTARALSLGVADRLHFCPPVDQDHLLHYLSGADVAVMPLRTGSANIEQALPNKLFENLHAGLPIVTSDARLIADFVREHHLGEVFSFGGEDDGATNLADAVRRVLADPPATDGPQWEQLRRAYSWQGQEGAIRDLYARLVPPPDPGGIEDPSFASLTLWDCPPAAAATVVAPARRGSTVSIDGRSA